ncbi:MAG: hypothetical protein ACRCYQ_17315, partial [Nocardioides sp.]
SSRSGLRSRQRRTHLSGITPGTIPTRSGVLAGPTMGPIMPESARRFLVSRTPPTPWTIGKGSMFR